MNYTSLAGTQNTATGTLHREFGNLNEYRNYPFAEGASLLDKNGISLATDIIVDACLYPVTTSSAILYLSEIDMTKGTVMVSGQGYQGTLSGNEADGVVELYDEKGRHAGTLVCGPGWEREKASGRVRTFSNAIFASSVCCVIPFSGVLSLSSTANPGVSAKGRNITLLGDDCITPVLEDGPRGKRLSFDAQAPAAKSGAVRSIVIIAKGKTPFSIEASENTALLTVPEMEREDVCYQAHQEDAIATVADTCKDPSDTCEMKPLRARTERAQISAGGSGAVSLVTPDLVNHKNPALVSSIGGGITIGIPGFGA